MIIADMMVARDVNSKITIDFDIIGEPGIQNGEEQINPFHNR